MTVQQDAMSTMADVRRRLDHVRRRRLLVGCCVWLPAPAHTPHDGKVVIPFLFELFHWPSCFNDAREVNAKDASSTPHFSTTSLKNDSIRGGESKSESGFPIVRRIFFIQIVEFGLSCYVPVSRCRMFRSGCLFIHSFSVILF